MHGSITISTAAYTDMSGMYDLKNICFW